MATVPQILNALTKLPADIEGKFTLLPKLSQGLLKVDSMLPAGPNLPIGVPNLPVPDLSKLPNLPNPFATAPATTTGSRLPLSPSTPGAQRGSVDYGQYARLPLSPTGPGATRGSVLYGQ